MTTDAPRTSRKLITAWALWDAGGAAFNAIMTTFVFTVYLTSKSFGSTEHATSVLSTGLMIAGVLIALLAPVTGQRSDASGKRGFWLALTTIATAVLMALCFFVKPDPAYLILGVALISAGNVVNEFSVVNYNAILPQISTKETVGRISGIGWSSGYFGGIVALGLVLVGFISPGILGIPTDGSLNIRSVALFAAAWCLLLSAPLLVQMKKNPLFAASSAEQAPRQSLVESYKELGRTLARLYRTAPKTLYFLVTSAIFRDGLTGIFTFGGVLAAGTFGFSTNQVIVFAIFGNIVAGVGALLGGRLDDVVGPKYVIMGSLIGILAVAIPLLVFPTTTMFWFCGLALCAFVGPAQSASRTYLSRVTPEGQEGEIFGLYSTTGRATSFLAPALFGFFVTVMGAQLWGIIGIIIIILVGLLMVLPLAARPQIAHSSL